ncbi:hypothetical protein ACFQGA_11715 [Marinobacter koreensis]|uniref:DUF2127 domain-containing protein n=1 Tax=Marinobacter koreensis TaxID=335974 RepID=A0ABW0RGB6_9GAMM|nr:hypothetical protein [Marinobacter koreensis]MCK7548445.1 hypothetical protein [Marinobacter koreensis]
MSDEGKKKPFLKMFSLADRASCEKAIRIGGIVAMVSAALTGIFAAIGFFSDPSDPELAYLFDPYMVLDFVIIFTLAIFILRKSRVASTTMLGYFIFNNLYFWQDTGNIQGLGITIVLFVVYLTAMRATYIWHGSYKIESHNEDI